MDRRPFQIIIIIVFYLWVFKPVFLYDTIPVFVGRGGIWAFIVAIILVWGVSFVFWGSMGLIRIVSTSIGTFLFGQVNESLKENRIEEEEVAVIVPAHNEALVIRETLKSLLKIVRKENIFVVSDGSTDRTVGIARSHKVNILELNSSKGKAGALEACIEHFSLVSRFKAVILADADTRLKEDYLKCALPFFNDKEVVAVAGYAATIWKPQKMSWKQLLFISHRDRVYFLNQRLVKFGQSWKHTNVTPIVPGFASIYKTSVLNRLKINPPGLVIEDFNMTFEVHHKKLGKIAHHPSVVGYTQDPDNVRDYFRQIKRWHLGFWQTIRLHGFWPGRFWLAMTLTLCEVILGSLVFLLLPVLLLLSFLPPAVLFLGEWPWFINYQYLFVAFFVGVWLSDYMLTIIVAFIQNRQEYLKVGLLFPAVRVLDAVAFLSAIPKAFQVRSSGKWVSPTRRIN